MTGTTTIRTKTRFIKPAAMAALLLAGLALSGCYVPYGPPGGPGLYGGGKHGCHGGGHAADEAGFPCAEFASEGDDGANGQETHEDVTDRFGFALGVACQCEGVVVHIGSILVLSRTFF